jgi:hypothetical protein
MNVLDVVEEVCGNQTLGETKKAMDELREIIHVTPTDTLFYYLWVNFSCHTIYLLHHVARSKQCKGMV